MGWCANFSDTFSGERWLYFRIRRLSNSPQSCEITLQEDCTSSHSHQLGMWISVSPNLLTTWSWVGIKWHNTVVLTVISLMIGEGDSLINLNHPGFSFWALYSSFTYFLFFQWLIGILFIINPIDFKLCKFFSKYGTYLLTLPFMPTFNINL